jgi:replicative DNA helicase
MKLEEYGNDFVTELKARYDSHGALRGISSGLDSVDGYTHGFLPRRLYYIGARPSQGKSALMLNMATDCAIRKQIPCGIISIESSGQEIIERVFSSVGNIPGDMLASGFWGPSQFADIQTLAGKIVGKPLYLYDKPNLNIAQVKSVARVMATMFKVKIIFIDYLQLIDSTNRKLTKMEQVADASKQLKELARELELPIVCLAQLRREADDRRPGLSDFQWASQIEQDADVAMLLWHEAKDEKTESWILIEKNRDGKKGQIPVSFMGEYVTFKEREV